jgi:hypothetical protein
MYVSCILLIAWLGRHKKRPCLYQIIDALAEDHGLLLASFPPLRGRSLQRMAVARLGLGDKTGIAVEAAAIVEQVIESERGPAAICARHW